MINGLRKTASSVSLPKQNNHMKLFLLLCCLLALQSGSRAQNNNRDSAMIAKMVSDILVNGTAYDNLRELCKTIGPRLTASPGMYAAEKWGAARLTGMKADKVWQQQCTVPHWVRGTKEVLMVAKGGNPPANRSFNILSLGNSQGTGPRGVTAPVMEVGTFAELESKKEQVKGKIVFYNFRWRQDYTETFNAYRDAGPYRGNGPSAAAKLGALGVIVRSLSSAPDNHPHTGATRYNDSFPKIAAVAIGPQDADRLSGLLKKGNYEFLLRNTCTMLPDTIAHNIIGEIKGSEFPEEIITLGGHLDSWDPAEGAHDDGAGIVQSMEIIRLFKAIGYQPKRTIRVVLFANEENGLRGGAKYADEAKAKNEKHIMALETDAGGFTPRGFSGTMNNAQLQKFQSWLPLLTPYGIHKMGSGGGGADIGPLNRQLGTPVIGLSPDSQRYFDVHHSATDVFENVNKRELHLGAGVIAALVYLVDQYGL
jgi:carboxypeptidase Q